ncbi:MAG: cystathionine beta-lyase [Maricaulaceae bacterium]|jgi:cystathionine beta-lyase
MSGKRPFRRTANPPIERGSTVLIERAEDLYRTDIQTYGRVGLAAQDALREEIMARTGAAACTLVSTGLQACTLALLSLTKSGDHVLAPDSVYGPTRRFCENMLSRLGAEVEFYKPRIGGDIAKLIRKNTSIIYLESPGSLTLDVQDVPAIVERARAAGIVSIIDDTWGGMSRFAPLKLGVDVAVHAATKYPSGGSDVFLGSISSREAKMGADIAAYAKTFGAGVSPEDAYLVLRSMHSLEARLAQHEASAHAVAQWLSERAEVRRVIFPGREDHPDHAIWSRDFTGSTGLLAAVFAEKTEAKINAFLNALEVFGLGFSFGGFESLALWSDPQLRRNHADWSGEGALMRFSIGLEPVDELTADLERGFKAMTAA